MRIAEISEKSSETDPDFIVRVGTLANIGSLHQAIGDRLHEYNTRYVAGDRPRIRYDLTSVQPRRINMSALTTLLATMDRFRQFTDTAAAIDIRWNPEVFGFLEDIGFFELGRALDLFTLDPRIIGGYEPGTTNPNTKLLYSPFEDDWSNDQREQAIQKDAIRNQVKETLLLLCGSLFRPSRGSRAIPMTLRDQILVTSSELVVNAHLWGRAAAFLGVQRSSRGITVCVCDSGEGFLNSLRKKQRLNSLPSTHLGSLAIGCVVNDQDFGLRRAIDMVTRYQGRVEISSYSAEIVWKYELWKYWVNVATDPSPKDMTLEERFARMWDGFQKSAGASGRQVGYCRDWATPLRGSRVTFEMPIQEL